MNVGSDILAVSPFRSDGSRVDRASRVYAAALGRYVSAIDKAVTDEVTSQLEELAVYDDEGNLAPGTRDRIDAALDRAAARVRADSVPEAVDDAGAHVARTRGVSLRDYEEEVEGLTDDPDRAGTMRTTADDADSGVSEATSLLRQEELIDSILDEAMVKLSDQIIEALDRRGTPDSRREVAADEIDDVLELTRNRADRIAAWETDSIHVEFYAVWNLANGSTTYDWITRDDDDVRALHAERHGLTFEWANPPDEEPFDGAPGFPPWCRCRPGLILPES